MGREWVPGKPGVQAVGYLLESPGQPPIGGPEVPFDLVEVAEQIVAVGAPNLGGRGLDPLEHLVERGGQRGEVGCEGHGWVLSPQPTELCCPGAQHVRRGRRATRYVGPVTTDRPGRRHPHPDRPPRASTIRPGSPAPTRRRRRGAEWMRSARSSPRCATGWRRGAQVAHQPLRRRGDRQPPVPAEEIDADALRATPADLRSALELARDRISRPPPDAAAAQRSPMTDAGVTIRS